MFTDSYGTGTTIAESPLREGLLFLGTDDGLVQITENGGLDWRKVDRLPGVPEFSYVNRCVPVAQRCEYGFRGRSTTSIAAISSRMF